VGESNSSVKAVERLGLVDKIARKNTTIRYIPRNLEESNLQINER
jgi:hypothetical protein